MNEKKIILEINTKIEFSTEQGLVDFLSGDGITQEAKNRAFQSMQLGRPVRYKVKGPCANTVQRIHVYDFEGMNGNNVKRLSDKR